MAKRYYRAPGHSPQYTNFQTALYVSRKARLMRGFAISPTRNSGNKYYFRSPRAPRKDRGEWIVTVLDQADLSISDPPGTGDGGGDAGGGGSLLPPPPLNGTRMYFKFGAYVFYGRDFHSGESGLINTWYYDDGTSFSESDGTVSGRFYYSIYSEYGDYSLALEQDYLRVTYRYTDTDPQCGPVFSFVDYATPDDRMTLTLLELKIGSVTIFDAAVDPDSENGDRPGRPIPTQLFDPAKPPHDYSTGAPPAPEPEPEPEPEPPPTADGWVFVDGSQYAYQCTCPDFTGEEHPYQTAIAPSQFRHRIWSGSGWQGMQKTMNFPCKHIISAGYKLQDWPSIFTWARAAAKDLPARELWQQAIDSYREYRDALRAEREEKKRAKQDLIDQRVAAKETREDAIDRVFMGRDLGIQNFSQGRNRLSNGRHKVSPDQLLQEQEANLEDLEYARSERRSRQWDEQQYYEANGIYKDFGPPGERASVSERLQYAIDNLQKIDDLGRFIANEGAKHGWGGNVTGGDPYSPIRGDV